MTPKYFAALGWYVFPCRWTGMEFVDKHGKQQTATGKEPLINSWEGAATRDPIQISAWAEQFPGCNWAVAAGKSGLTIYDIDPGGDESLLTLELEHGDLPETRTHGTPRGGKHYIFAGVGPTSSGRVGKGIDTRSAGGYCLLPGSVVGGRPYTVERDVPIGPPPAWLTARLNTKKEVDTHGTETEDSVEALARARDFLRAQPGVAPGTRGSTAYRHSASLRDLGVSLSAAHELVGEWNLRCEPPQEDDELAKCVDHAYKYAQNPAGSKAVTLGEGFDLEALKAAMRGGDQERDALPTGLLGVPRGEREGRPYPWVIRDEEAQDALEDPKWLLPGHVPEDSLGALIGPQESYKSFIAADLALAVASGKPWLNRAAVGQPGAVVYCAGEGATNLAKRRRKAWRAARGLEEWERLPFYHMNAVPLIQGEQVQLFVKNVKELGLRPKLVVFDTLARMMGGLDESSAAEMGLAIAAADYVRRELGTAVVFVAHTGKDPTKGLRGSSAAIGAMDWAASIEANKEAKTARVACAKMKDAENFETIHLQGRVSETSLVFDCITSTQYAEAVGEFDQVPIHMVEDALRDMGADISHATKPLAMAIVRQMGGEMDDTRVVDSVRKYLSRHAATKFKHLATRDGLSEKSHWLWKIEAETF